MYCGIGKWGMTVKRLTAFWAVCFAAVSPVTEAEESMEDEGMCRMIQNGFGAAPMGDLNVKTARIRHARLRGSLQESLDCE